MVQEVLELRQLDLKLLPQTPHVAQSLLRDAALLVLMVTPVQTRGTCKELCVGLALQRDEGVQTYLSLSREILSSALSSWTFS